MKAQTYRVTVQDSDGTTVHEETRRAMNAGIRASEAAVREAARAAGGYMEGERPERVGQLYTRQWFGAAGALVASVELV